MDDFSIFESSFDSCLVNLTRVLHRCQDDNLVLNWEKCHFMVKESSYWAESLIEGIGGG